MREECSVFVEFHGGTFSQYLPSAFLSVSSVLQAQLVYTTLDRHAVLTP